MKASEIRESFLEFFRERGHAIVPSAPVVLPSDPTLLFTNAGMNPFKDIFLGARKPEARRVADTQKCIRVSGKHNDLEEVGHDTYHHTFFEMLGNWSFGDYYKREAIAWAWELLTGRWKLPKDRLWATVYRDDDEAARIWGEVTDLPPERVLRFGEKDNFWEMGETGPCGPCSEIHFDRTPGGAGPERVNAGTPDVIELWNLVFIQHNRRADGALEDLPARHVDTGMGFERMTAVLQGQASNYDTDLFRPLIEAVGELSGRPYAGDDAVAMRVIADHIRTLAVAVADGVLPSNEGRGYVLRRLLRRAARYGRTLELTEPFLGRLVPVVETSLGSAFPELGERRTSILRALQAEEESFSQTLDRGLALFEQVAERVRSAGGRRFPGDEAFKLYDTFGFPLDLTRLMAAERELGLDEAEFASRMEAQRARARGARKDGDAGGEAAADLVARGLSSVFVGYDNEEVEARVLALAGPAGLLDEAGEGEEVEILLDRTPFYGEAGGQVGDTGRIEGPDAGVDVGDTKKPAEGLILHRGRVRRGRLSPGAPVTAAIDRERRARLRRHHTAAHLLNAALRMHVDSAVRQAGSLVAPDRLRFDFTWPEALDAEVLARIEETVGEWILEDHPVRVSEMPFSDVPGSGIVAIFDEKYGETVRVVEVEGVSRELCGGTHAARTSQVGLFRIVAESSVAAGIRRIEAVCGEPALAWTRRQHALVRDLCRRFSAAEEELPARIEALQEQNRELARALRAQAEAAALGRVDALLESVREIDGCRVLVADAGETDAQGLRRMLDALRERLPDALILLGAASGGKALFAAAAGEAAVRAGVHAGRLVGQVARVAGGGGGGQAHRAQAGGRDGAKLPDALDAAPDLIAGMLA